MLPLDLYLITFNCGRTIIDIKSFSQSLFQAYKDEGGLPDIISISLQEIAPIAYSFLGNSLLRPYYDAIIEAVNLAAGPRASYLEVKRHNAGMTAIVVLAKTTIMNQIQLVQTADIGVGDYGLGNKGAAGVRVFLRQNSDASETTPLTFVSAHLGPHEDAVERRNKDWSNIVRGLVFSSGPGSGKEHAKTENSDGNKVVEAEPLLQQDNGDNSAFSTTSSGIFNGYPLYFSGDLNYRTSDVSPKIDDHQQFPQPVTDIADPHHYCHLLKRDQLSRERNAGRTLHCLTEATIEFPPTYKYDVDRYSKLTSEEPDTWYWAKHRQPSWCDRILYSSYLTTSAVKILSYSCMPIQPTSDHRPVGLALRLDMQRAESQSQDYKSPFPLDRQWKSQRSAARRRELVVGMGAYLGLTMEGRMILIATTIGILGVWLVSRSLLA